MRKHPNEDHFYMLIWQMKMALESICCLFYFVYIEHKPIVDIQTTKIYFTINLVCPSEIDFTQDAFLHYISTIFKLLVNVNMC